MPRFIRNKWTWVAALAAVALYAGAGFLLVPRLVAGGIRDYVATHYHRSVDLGEVAFNPFTLELTIRRFALPDADGGPLLGFDRLYVNAEIASIFRGGADFAAIALDGPRVRLLRRPDGRFNVLDLVPPPDPGRTAARPDPDAQPPKVWIHELTVRGGETSLKDLSRRDGLDVTLRPITFTLREFSTRSEGNEYHLAARSVAGEEFEWQGTFGLEPVVSAGSFRISGLRTATIAEAANGSLPVELAGGQINVTGRYDAAEHGDQLALVAKVAEVLGTDLALRAPGEQDAWLKIPRLAVTDTTLDLAAQAISVEHVKVDGTSVTAWREPGGEINLSRLVKSSAPANAPSADATPPAPSSAPAAPAKPWTIHVPDIQVAGTDVTFEDRTVAHPAHVHLSSLDVGVRGFAIPSAGPLGLEVTTKVNESGHLGAKGTLALAPLDARLAVDGTGLGLTALQPYLDKGTALGIKSGTAGFRGHLAATGGGAVKFDGEAVVDGLRTVDKVLEEDFVRWKRLRLAGISATSQPVSLRISEVSVEAPYARMIIGSNGLTNVAAVLQLKQAPAIPPASGAAPAAPAARAPAARAPASRQKPPAATVPAPPPAAIPLEIGTVRIAGGSMNFADFSIKPNVSTGIQDLHGTVKGLSGRADSRADVKLEGQVDKYAPVSITGKINPLAAQSYSDLSMSFKNVELGVLSPYSGKFAGYQIDKGKLSLDLHYTVENRRLVAAQRIIVNQLQLGARVDSPDATHLPIKLAIALLKDKDGVIDLDLPMSGSLDDPSFSIGKIIWKVIVNTLEKIVTSPFRLLGALFGGGEEMSFVDFPAGVATLDPANRAKIASLVKALDSRPALNVDLPQIVSPDADRAALVAHRWRADLEARATRRLGPKASAPGAIDALLASPKDYRALLEEAYREGFGHKPEIPVPDVPKGSPAPDPTAIAVAWLESQLKPRVTIGQDELDALAAGRAAAVQSALLDGTGIDPGRVFVIKSAPVVASGESVRMQIALH